MRSTCVLNLLSNKSVRSFRAVREEEINSFISKIKQSCNSSASSVLNLSEMLTTLTNDIICRVATGRKYSDKEMVVEGCLWIFPQRSMSYSHVLTLVTISQGLLGSALLMHGLDAQLDSLAKRFDEFLDMVVQEHIDKSTGIVHMVDEDHKARILWMFCFQFRKKTQLVFISRELA